MIFAIYRHERHQDYLTVYADTWQTAIDAVDLLNRSLLASELADNVFYHAELVNL